MQGISGRGYDGKQWILIDEASQRMLRVGDVVTTFRGEKGTVTGAQPPHKASSTGKVELDGFLYGPTVVGARWVRL